MNERNEIDEIAFTQAHTLKYNLPLETLGDHLPPKSDLVFELKKLSNTLKYAYLDD